MWIKHIEGKIRLLNYDCKKNNVHQKRGTYLKYREILHSNNKLLQLHGFSKRAFLQGIEIN